MKTKYWFSMTLVCVFALFEVGYTQPAKDSKTVPMVLKHANQSPETGSYAKSLNKAFSEIERLTEGRIKVESYWGQSLLKAKEILRGIDRGVCDLGWVGPPSHPAEIPLNGVHEFIFYVPKGDDASWMARKTWEFIDKCKELNDEFKKWGQAIWFTQVYDGYCLFTNKKTIRTLEDIKGLRIRVIGQGQAKMFSAVGGVPVAMTMAETYTALEKGTIEGAMAGIDIGKRYSLHEVAPNISEMYVFLLYNFVNVSLRSLEKMSKKDKEIFLEVGRRVSFENGEALRNDKDEIKAFLEKKGVKFTPFPDGEKVKWAKTPKIRALIKNWVDEQNAAGRPGTKVMDTLLTTFEVPQ